MKKILWLLFFYPCLVFGQANPLYTLLNWNTPEQQKGLIAWYDLQDPSVVQLVSDQRVSKNQLLKGSDGTKIDRAALSILVLSARGTASGDETLDPRISAVFRRTHIGHQLEAPNS